MIGKIHFNVCFFSFLTATVQEEAGDDHAVCQITSERFQKSLQRHLSLYVIATQQITQLATSVGFCLFKYVFTTSFFSSIFFLICCSFTQLSYSCSLPLSLSMSSFSIYNLTPPCPLFFLCRWCHTGHSEKHRWLHQCKLHQCESVPLVFCLSWFRQCLFFCLLRSFEARWVVCFCQPSKPISKHAGDVLYDHQSLRASENIAS